MIMRLIRFGNPLEKVCEFFSVWETDDAGGFKRNQVLCLVVGNLTRIRRL